MGPFLMNSSRTFRLEEQESDNSTRGITAGEGGVCRVILDALAASVNVGGI